MSTGVQIAYITSGYGKVQYLEGINVDMESKEKTRLINAHEVLLTDKERKACMFDAGMAFLYQEAKIIEAPTVEAIPIEWLKKWAENGGDEPVDDFTDVDAYCDGYQKNVIECLLRAWEKENDIYRGR